MSETYWLFLSKALPIFVYPVGLTISLIVIGSILTLLGAKTRARLALCLALAVLWVSSTPKFADYLYSDLETRYPAIPISQTPAANVAIVLGGAVGQPIAPRPYIDLGPAADRVWHAARLYRAGKVSRIVVAAGNIPWLAAEKTEAELISELLRDWNVDADAITIEGKSRNTYENAVATKALYDQESWTSALLVTSAAHMPRAMSIFRDIGIPVTPSSTDVRVAKNTNPTIFDWLPNAGALVLTSAAMKEWIGHFVYRLSNRLKNSNTNAENTAARS